MFLARFFRWSATNKLSSMPIQKTLLKLNDYLKIYFYEALLKEAVTRQYLRPLKFCSGFLAQHTTTDIPP